MLTACMEEAQTSCKVDERARRFSELIRKYRPLLNATARPLFDWMARTAQSQETNNPDEMRRRKLCRDFIETIAYDYADMIAALIRSIPAIVPYASHIILGGYGGTHFGLCPNEESNEDIFLDALQQEIKQHSGRDGVPVEIEIFRSQASQSVYRLLDVCRYLEEQKSAKA